MTAISLVAVFSFFIWRLFRRQNPSEAEIEWLNEFSIETYQPMVRLLHENDYEFLSKQPGYHPSISQDLRAERCRIFRSYLHSLVHDFNILIRLAKFILVHAPQDRQEFARDILHMQLEFYRAVAAAEIRLALSPLPVGAINVKRLIGSLSVVHENVGKAAMRAMPA
ncbi:MAG: hypothetical protein ACR2NN_22485 [Bryobacteraceae bacterium]